MKAQGRTWLPSESQDMGGAFIFRTSADRNAGRRSLAAPRMDGAGPQARVRLSPSARSRREGAGADVAPIRVTRFGRCADLNDSGRSERGLLIAGRASHRRGWASDGASPTLAVCAVQA